MAEPDPFAPERALMVAGQIRARGVRDPAVLAAMAAVPRHRFVPAALLDRAHDDSPLPIGLGQTLSQPFIVAWMAEALALTGAERVLEVGSGSGYAAAVLARLAREVHGVELEPDLHARAVAVLADLGVANAHLHCGDGHGGWPEAAPYDAVLLSCAAASVPAPLLAQLAPGGVLLLPLGAPEEVQTLVRLRRAGSGWSREDLLAVRFVPLRRA